MLRKLTVIAILVALVISAFPTAGVLAAGGSNKDLEKKWEQLVNNFNRQEMEHAKIHKWAEAWLAKNKTAEDRTEVVRHLSTCNYALVTAQAIVSRHAGFNANGKVTQKHVAAQTINALANALRMHAGSVKNIIEHVK